MEPLAFVFIGLIAISAFYFGRHIENQKVSTPKADVQDEAATEGMKIEGLLTSGKVQKTGREFELVEILEFDDKFYAKFVGEIFENFVPATRAHVLVAYQNLQPILGTVAHLYKKQEGENFTVEQFINQTAKRLEEDTEDEINSRRRTWFLYSAILLRLERLSKNDPEITEIGAKIWCTIAEDSPHLKRLLPENVVWKPEEKQWFDLSMSDKELIQWTVNHAMPSTFAEHDLVKTFAKSKEIAYLPNF